MGEETSRRDFLKKSGAVAVGLGVGLPVMASLGCGHEKAEGGTRWAMVVDTQKCRQADGCRDCMERCHEVHNVPDLKTEDGKPNKKEEVKWIWKENFNKAFPSQEQEHMKAGLEKMPTLIFCNHCENPPCVLVCPTQATFQREDGIVMMDMHRCIGCRYCIVGCPYGSRSFNWRDPWPDRKEIPNPDYPSRTKGVVEKCNGCAELLAKGEKPACVDACSHGALIYGDLNDPDSEVRKILNTRYTIRRKPGLGTLPHVFYVV